MPIATALLLLATSTDRGATVPLAKRPPNVVLIMADDLGYGELGCYGQTKIKTPHLDQLGREGVRFTRFYSASTVCAPTRCALLTGKHTGRAAIRGNKEVGGWKLNEGEGQMSLAPSETTIAEVMQRNGYATGCFGKWGLGAPGSEGHPLRHGFDTFFGYLCQRQAHNYTPTHLWSDNDVFILDKNRYFSAHQRLPTVPAHESAFDGYLGEQYAPAVTVERAEAFVRKNRAKPFFLYFASTLPHVALQAPASWVDQYPKAWDPESYLGQQGYLPCARPRATYAAMVSCLDDSVGRLMRMVDELGIAEDTLFIFKSDNGTAPNGGVDRVFFNSLGGLRGLKTNLYEGGIRVPFLARWKGSIPAGRTLDFLSASYDVFPTLCELIGARLPRGLDGVSLAPTLMGTGPSKRHEFLYFEYPEETQQQAVVTDRYKLIFPNLQARREQCELYDLVSDPGETRDLSLTHAAELKRLRQIANREHRPSASFPIPALDGPLNRQ